MAEFELRIEEVSRSIRKPKSKIQNPKPAMAPPPSDDSALNPNAAAEVSP
jgi:hypothetical protein